MQVRTLLPAALVYMNDREVGRTPFSRDFMWYGNYYVRVRQAGYQTLRTNQWVVAPWWQWPPLDLFVELLPIRFKDRQTIQFELQPASTQPADPDQMLSRAGELGQAITIQHSAPACRLAGRVTPQQQGAAPTCCW